MQETPRRSLLRIVLIVLALGLAAIAIPALGADDDNSASCTSVGGSCSTSAPGGQNNATCNTSSGPCRTTQPGRTAPPGGDPQGGSSSCASTGGSCKAVAPGTPAPTSPPPPIGFGGL